MDLLQYYSGIVAPEPLPITRKQKYVIRQIEYHTGRHSRGKDFYGAQEFIIQNIRKSKEIAHDGGKKK